MSNRESHAGHLVHVQGITSFLRKGVCHTHSRAGIRLYLPGSPFILKSQEVQESLTHG